MTRRRALNWFIRLMSWVAITTDVPSRLSSTKRRMQPPRERRVDVAGRLVGEQDLGLADQRAGDRGALLLPARQHRREGVHAVAEADPAEELDHVGAVARLLLVEDTERQRDILEGGQVVEQAEILEYDADPPAHRRQVALASEAASRSKTVIRPRVGFMDRKKRRISDVLPAPDGPVRNWKERGSISKLRSRRISGPTP